MSSTSLHVLSQHGTALLTKPAENYYYITLISIYSAKNPQGPLEHYMR